MAAQLAVNIDVPCQAPDSYNITLDNQDSGCAGIMTSLHGTPADIDPLREQIFDINEACRLVHSTLLLVGSYTAACD